MTFRLQTCRLAYSDGAIHFFCCTCCLCVIFVGMHMYLVAATMLLCVQGPRVSSSLELLKCCVSNGSEDMHTACANISDVEREITSSRSLTIICLQLVCSNKLIVIFLVFYRCLEVCNFLERSVILATSTSTCLYTLY